MVMVSKKLPSLVFKHSDNAGLVFVSTGGGGFPNQAKQVAKSTVDGSPNSRENTSRSPSRIFGQFGNWFELKFRWETPTQVRLPITATNARSSKDVFFRLPTPNAKKTAKERGVGFVGNVMLFALKLEIGFLPLGGCFNEVFVLSALKQVGEGLGRTRLEDPMLLGFLGDSQQGTYVRSPGDVNDALYIARHLLHN